MGILEKIFGRKKRPSNINGALEDMSHMLTQYKEDPTFGVEILHGFSLDFSIDSLMNINGYLDIVRERQNEISPDDLQFYAQVLISQDGAVADGTASN